MRRRILAVLAAAPLLAGPPPAAEAPREAAAPPEMKLWKVLDLSAYPGMFPCPGDLDGDGRVDFLLCRQGPQSTPGYLVAVDFTGSTLWERGDPSISSHAPDGQWNEPALRGIALVFDIDGDGSAEVVTELWEKGAPTLCVLDGATGRTERSIPSPLSLQVRGGKRSRCHTAARIAYLTGRGGPPALVLKYGASNFVPCHAVALDAELRTIWHTTTDPHAMGHVPSVADIDGDGRDEFMPGTILLDDDATHLWEKKVAKHADCTAAAELHPAPGMEIVAGICGTGPVYCFSSRGEVLWEKTREEVPHGQGVWVGDFLSGQPGPEVIVLKSGHVGDFLTLRGLDGETLAAFTHKTVFDGYPDFPQAVNWTGGGAASLWVPIDRTVVDGTGKVIAALGKHEERVAEALRYGVTKDVLGVQAIPLDLAGDGREELVLYQPYRGRAIIIFTQPDAETIEKPYVHQRNAYNLRTYF